MGAANGKDFARIAFVGLSKIVLHIGVCSRVPPRSRSPWQSGGGNFANTVPPHHHPHFAGGAWSWMRPSLWVMAPRRRCDDVNGTSYCHRRHHARRRDLQFRTCWRTGQSPLIRNYTCVASSTVSTTHQRRKRRVSKNASAQQLTTIKGQPGQQLYPQVTSDCNLRRNSELLIFWMQ